MKKFWLTASSGATLFLVSQALSAAPALRVQVEQKGDFLIIGNTLGHECAAGTPAPVVGNVGMCGNSGSLGDSAPDVFWRSQSPMAMQAEANTGITNAQARSTALLALPPGATVTHAFLYWGANTNGGDDTATLDRPGGFSQNLTALQVYTGANNSYQSVADITSIVQAQGPGAYRVSGVQAANIVNADNNNNFAGWWMVVLYNLPTDPVRNLAVFDGLDLVQNGQNQNATLSGFLVPPAFGQAKLGIVTFEGDNSIQGDQFFFDGDQLSNAQNPATNFFNGTRSVLGLPVSVPGDLPQLTGTAQSMSGMDIDVVDVTAQLTAGQMSAPIQATSTGDVYFLAGFVTSIPTFKPDFSSSSKTVVDLNGGTVMPGDTLEYTISVINDGNDPSIDTVLTDVIPAGTTYVPATINITAGANMGMKSDPANDDQCEYTAGNTTITCRLGTGANAMNGGTMAIGESATITFQVTVNPGFAGIIANQAIINAGGQQGSPPEDTPTDGNGPSSGQPPTETPVDECTTDADCAAPEPFCNVTGVPKLCVECLLDMDCPALEPTCDPGTNTCVCVPTGEELCDGLDNDCNGTIDDNASGAGLPCATGLPGECAAGTTACSMAMIECVPDVMPGAQPELCGDALDSDCDGANDNGFNLGQACTNGLGICEAAGTIVCMGPNASGCDAVAGEPGVEMCDDLLDSDCDGNPDNGCLDTDGDGIKDDVEVLIGTDPNDADSDDDGVPDGEEPDFDLDSDGDGLINALDPDSDNDGLFDGTELGLDCSGPGTDTNAENCIPDGDGGATTTDPLDADTDDGGLPDGAEDTDLDGTIDPGEKDPNEPSDDDDGITDTDGDGVPDDTETQIGTDPNDADTDDDGVSDGAELNPTSDTDGDGLINALDPDSDNDGLFDGTELGLDCSNPDTDTGNGNCIADGDGGASTTSPLDPDTDDGGVSDGAEDFNHNGTIDEGEGDPNEPGDDIFIVDDDGDGLSNGEEGVIGTDPNDADSDDDGAIDGDEPNPTDDTDGDGDINALDPDSDNDGLFDGTELGFDCSNPGTDQGAGNCEPDGDAGSTTTSPLDSDSDDGGVSDGDEDADHDGVVDIGETDPNDGSDDFPGTGGAGGTGGGTGGTGGGTGGAGGGMGGTGGMGGAGDDITFEGGCACSTPARSSSVPSGLWLLAAAAVLGLRRRRTSNTG